MQQKLESSSEVFDQMAQGWYGFRHWTIFRVELEILAQRWQQGWLINLGCGHGADFLPFKHKFKLTGIDFSSTMLDMARRYAQKHHFKAEFNLADMRRLPYPEACFDCAIAIASYHHLRDHSEQLAALSELKRVLKPGAEAFITVWNRWQPRFWFKGREIMLPWRNGETIVYRYYYLFSYAEIEGLTKQAGFILLKSFPESQYKLPFKRFSHNICLLIKKPN